MRTIVDQGPTWFLESAVKEEMLTLLWRRELKESGKTYMLVMLI